MIFEGSHSVIDAIKEKKRLADNNRPHDHIRPLLIIDGGLMKGAYGTGAAIALTELSLLNTFTGIVGVSAGAVIAAYTLADDVVKGSTMLYEELCTKQFWNPWRIHNPLRASFVTDILNGKTGKLLQDKKIFRHQVPFYVGLSHFDTAWPELFCPTNRDELLKAIQASISMPGAVTEKVYINGKRYVDGASTMPHILEFAVAELPATHILIIANQDKTTKSIPVFEKILCRTLFRLRFSNLLLKASNNRRESRHEYLSRLKSDPSVVSAVVWGNGQIGSFERNRIKIKKTIESSRIWWHELFA